MDLATDIRSQVDRFTELLGTEPSHVDVHVPHKLGDGILDVLEVVSELGYPTRHLGFCRAPDCVTDTPAFVATGVPNSRIAAWLDSLPPGLHEIVLHPGKMDTSCQSTLNAGRERDARLARWLAQEVDARIAFELARSDGGTRGS